MKKIILNIETNERFEYIGPFMYQDRLYILDTNNILIAIEHDLIICVDTSFNVILE